MTNIEDISIKRITLKDDDLEQEGLLLTPVSVKAGPYPLIVFLHGFNRFGAWELIFPAQRLLKEGFAVLLPSQLGFGGSKGTRDYCGPKTVEMIASLMKEVSAFDGIDASRIGMWGISRGATVTALLAVRHPELLKAAIVQAGTYDFAKEATRDSKPKDIVENIVHETGGTPDAYQDRTSVTDMESLACPLRIIHGELDETTSPEQAHLLGERLTVLGKAHDLILVPNAGHHLSGPLHTKGRILPFFKEKLGI